MFDIGFWELVLVGVVALLVVGPERLPKVAYEVGLWFGRMQRYLRNAQFQIENELHNYEIKNTLQQPAKMLEEIKSEIDQIARDPWLPPPLDQPPADNPPGAAVNNSTGAANNMDMGNNAPAKTEASPDDGQSKPRT